MTPKRDRSPRLPPGCEPKAAGGNLARFTGQRPTSQPGGAYALTEADVITCKLTPGYVDLAAKYAKTASVGGVSRIREGEERQENLWRDQLIGLLGNLAGCLWAYGGPREFIRSREEADEMPWAGDNGQDLPNRNVDFKTSWLDPNRSPLSYVLPVRPAERHAGWVYVLGCCVWPLPEDGSATVYLVGWTPERRLPRRPDAEGEFAGAFTLPARLLHPLPPMRWVP